VADRRRTDPIALVRPPGLAMSDDEAPAGPGPDRALDALVAVAVRAAAADRLAPAAGSSGLAAITEAAAAVLQATAASIALYDSATNALVFRVAAGPEGAGVIGLSIPAYAGIAGYVYSTGQPLAIADVATDPRFQRATAERTGYVPRSLLAVPLVDDAGLVGVMEVLDRRDGQPFDLTDLDVASRLAAAAIAIIRATRVEREAAVLLRDVLVELARSGPESLPADAVEALVEAATERMAGKDGLWRLADRIGRLRAGDPDDLDLAIAWLDALIDRTDRRRDRSGRRAGG
jgi:GAF domain-containing protein